MGKKSKSPDYRGGAEETAAGNQKALEYQTAANRVDQVTPWGNLTWHGKPGEEGYGQELALSNNQQAIFNTQEQIQDQRQQNALGLGGRLQQEMQRPEGFYNDLPEVAGTPDVPTYGEGLTQFGQGGQGAQVQQLQGSQYDPRFAEQAFQRQVSLIRPGHEDQQERQEVQLRNQGLAPGTQAYDTALSNLRSQQGEELNALSADAVDRGRSEQQAEFQRSMQAGSQRFGQEGARFQQQMAQGSMYDQQRQQQAAEQLQFGGQGFSQQMQQQNQQNELRQRAITEQQGREVSALNLQNAATSGQQVNMPQMPGYNQAGYVGGPDYLGAANMQGQFNNEQYATSMGPINAGLGALGSWGGGP